MTYIDKVLKLPNSIKLLEKKNHNFIVKGQGIFVFSNQDSTKKAIFHIYDSFYNDGLIIEFELNKIKVCRISNNQQLKDKNNSSGLTTKKGAYYWFSIDATNKYLYGGVGESRIDNVEYKFIFEDVDKSFLESLCKIIIDEAANIIPLKIIRDPIRKGIPMYVKNSDELTMNDVAQNFYLPSANLTSVGQKLYNCISGKNFVLDDDDFHYFSKAIENSIKTPGLWCYQKLKDKATEFNPEKPNILETYLRITLNQNNGESPGIPYVMEIWPVGHFSPIHNHSGANAIIRVLHGSINVSLFSFLCEEKDGLKPFAKCNFNKDDITWISANLNQTHQLKNLDVNNDTCITIQCYMYDENDNNHYEYFDFIDDDGNKKKYDPDSDMDFIEFKNLMKKEWMENRVRKLYT